MTRRAKDDLTLDLFAVPQPHRPIPASMDHRATVAHLVADMLKAADGDRYAIAAEMSRLTGKDISKAMLDAYTSEARDAWNLPYWLGVVLERACQSHVLTTWSADVHGGRLLLGKDNLAAQLGRLVRAKEETDQQIKQLKKLMGEMG